MPRLPTFQECLPGLQQYKFLEKIAAVLHVLLHVVRRGHYKLVNVIMPFAFVVTESAIQKLHSVSIHSLHMPGSVTNVLYDMFAPPPESAGPAHGHALALRGQVWSLC